MLYADAGGLASRMVGDRQTSFQAKQLSLEQLLKPLLQVSGEWLTVLRLERIVCPLEIWMQVVTLPNLHTMAVGRMFEEVSVRTTFHWRRAVEERAALQKLRILILTDELAADTLTAMLDHFAVMPCLEWVFAQRLNWSHSIQAEAEHLSWMPQKPVPSDILELLRQNRLNDLARRLLGSNDSDMPWVPYLQLDIFQWAAADCEVKRDSEVVCFNKRSGENIRNIAHSKKKLPLRDGDGKSRKKRRAMSLKHIDGSETLRAFGVL